MVSLQFLKHISVRQIENRSDDVWYDMSLRQMRRGEVSFFVVKDFLTGEWLFKLSKDSENGKVMVKAVKCPAGVRFSQLEGSSMVFQDSQIQGMLYDVISLTYLDEHNRLRRDVVSDVQEVPSVIRDNFEISSYEEATGKKVPGKHLVSLIKRGIDKKLVKLFVLERAWGLSEFSPEEKLEEKRSMKQLKKVARKEVDTGRDLVCPVCGEKHRLVHVEFEKTVRHVLRKLN